VRDLDLERGRRRVGFVRRGGSARALERDLRKRAALVRAMLFAEE